MREVIFSRFALEHYVLLDKGVADVVVVVVVLGRTEVEPENMLELLVVELTDIGV